MPARVCHQPGDGVLAAGGVMEDDLFEVEELQRTAEWRMRMVDANPADATSREAAALLEKLAEDVQQRRGSALFREYTALCNWLGESDGIADFMNLANDYRARIGVDRFPENGEAYLRALLDLAKQTFGVG
jgi:hypothetical protein